jgi:hypothetical protein
MRLITRMLPAENLAQSTVFPPLGKIPQRGEYSAPHRAIHRRIIKIPQEVRKSSMASPLPLRPTEIDVTTTVDHQRGLIWHFDTSPAPL